MTFARSDIHEKIARFVKRDPASLASSARLKELVVDSFRLVELVMTLQEQFDVIISQDDLVGVETVEQLTDVFFNRIAAGDA